MTFSCLTIHNHDATPKDVNFVIESSAIRQVVSWYAAFHSGDNYVVSIDGEAQQLDLNGALK